MDRFRIISQLGAGGFGEAFRAWDTKHSVPVVLKRPLAKHLQRLDVLERFDREINRLRELTHPHIVPIVDHGHDDRGRPFLVMRFLPGGSLADRKKPQSLPFLYRWLPGVAAALDYIHTQGVLHRDVKPSNIFFDTQSKAFLGDFGIARLVDDQHGNAFNALVSPTADSDTSQVCEDSLTITGQFMGTLPYAAPELFEKHPRLTTKADQYSLAVAVYELLSNSWPVKANGSRDYRNFHQSDQKPESLSARLRNIPASIAIAVDRALKKRPEDRFATCQEFAAAVLADVPFTPVDPLHYRFLCPACHRLVRVPHDFGGRNCRCPDCQASLRVAEALDALWLAQEDPSNSGSENRGSSEFSKLRRKVEERDALWTHEEAPHAVVGTEPKTTRVSEVRQHNSSSGDKPISQRAHMPWGCLTVAGVSLFVALIAMGLLPAGFFEGRTDGVGSLSLAATLIAMGCAVLVLIAALIFGVLGFFTPVTVDHTPESTSRQRAQLPRRQVVSHNLRSAVKQATVLKSASIQPSDYTKQLEFSDYLHAIPWYVAIIATVILPFALALPFHFLGLDSRGPGGDLLLSTVLVCSGVSAVLSAYLVVRACFKALGSLFRFAHRSYERALYGLQHNAPDGKKDGPGSRR